MRLLPLLLPLLLLPLLATGAPNCEYATGSVAASTNVTGLYGGGGMPPPRSDPSTPGRIIYLPPPGGASSPTLWTSTAPHSAPFRSALADMGGPIHEFAVLPTQGPTPGPTLAAIVGSPGSMGVSLWSPSPTPAPASPLPLPLPPLPPPGRNVSHLAVSASAVAVAVSDTVYVFDVLDPAAPPATVPLPSPRLVSLALGDVSGDGLVDLVLSCAVGGSGSKLALALGIPPAYGSLARSAFAPLELYPAQLFAAPVPVSALAITDVNRDGFDDIAFARNADLVTPYGPVVGLALTTPLDPTSLDVQFVELASELADVALSRHSLALIDVNSDGNLDLVVALAPSGNISWVPNTGYGVMASAGTLLPPLPLVHVPPPAAGPRVVLSGGRGLVLVADPGSPVTPIVDLTRPDTGSGFARPSEGQSYGGGPAAAKTSVAPLVANLGGGGPDMVFALVDGSVSVVKGASSDSVGGVTAFAGCSALAMAPAAHPQHSSVMCVDGVSLRVGSISSGGVLVSVSVITIPGVLGGQLDSIVAVYDVDDVSGSDRPDVVVGCSAGCVGGSLFVVDIEPAGVLSASAISSPPVSFLTATPDGAALLFANGSQVWRSLAAGSGYAPAMPLASMNGTVVGIGVGHADTDRHLDLFVGTESQVVVLVGSGAGGFVPIPVAVLDSPSTIVNMDVADVTGDGLADVFVSRRQTSSHIIDWWESTGALSWAAPVELFFTTLVGQARVAARSFGGPFDLDTDGHPDVIVWSEPLLWVLTTAGHVPPGRTPTVSHTFSPSLPVSVHHLSDILEAQTECWMATLTLQPGQVIEDCGVDQASVLQPTWGTNWRVVGKRDGTPDVDCSSSGGGAFAYVSSGAILTLDGMHIHGGTYGVDTSVVNTVSVAGSAVLVVIDSTFSQCSTAGADALVQLNTGLGSAVGVADGYAVLLRSRFSDNTAEYAGGALALTVAGSHAVALHCVFERNTALASAAEVGTGGGGAVLVQGAGARFAALNTTFTDNSVAKGVGGAVLVREYATGCDVVLRGGAMTRNSAAVAGGSLAVMSSSSRVSLDGELVITGSEAGGAGGVVAAVDPGYAFPAPSSGLSRLVSVDFPLASLGSPATTEVNIGPGVVVASAAAPYGGVAFACGAGVASTGFAWSAEATDGVYGFVCLASNDTAVAVEADWISGVGSSEVSTHPLTLQVVEPVPARIAAGLPLGGGAVAARNGFGAPINDGHLTVRLQKVTSSGVALSNVELGIAGEVRDSTVVFPLGQATLYPALEWLAPVANTTLGRRFEFEAQLVGPGAVVGLALSTNVTSCPVGYGRDMGTDVVMVCGACPDGSQSPEQSLAPCVATPECGDRALRVVQADGNGTATGTQCVCTVGTWSRSVVAGASALSEGEACVLCPRGAVCKGGLEVPSAAPGFWPESATVFVECWRGAAACAGAGVCASGYSGYMCNTCASGYYSSSAGECQACPPGSTGITVTSLVVAVGVGLAVGVFLGRKAGQIKAGRLRERTVPASVTMVIVAGQTIAILLQTDLSWSRTTQRVFGFAQVFVLDTSLFASECALSSFHAKWAIGMATLGALWVSVLGGALVYTRVRGQAGSELSVGGTIDMVTASLATVLYLPLTKTTLVLFDCRRLPSGQVVMDVDPGVACFDSEWWGLVPIAAAGVVVVLGLPLYFWVRLRRVTQAGELDTVASFIRLGPLYRLYKSAYSWGEVAQMAKRLVFVGTSLFLSGAPLVQLFALLALLAGASLALPRTYFFPLYSELERELGLSVVVVVLLGVASYAESGADTLGMTLAAIAAVLLFVAISGRGIVLDILEILAERKGAYDPRAKRRASIAAYLARESMDWHGQELALEHELELGDLTQSSLAAS